MVAFEKKTHVPSSTHHLFLPKWLKLATSSRSGYFGMPCGAKKNLGRVEKFEKTRFFQYFYWRILEIYWNLKFWKKLSHKNAIKMIWGVLFLLPSRKISQTVAPLIKIVALIWQDFGATFWRFLTQKVAPSDSKHLASLQSVFREAWYWKVKGEKSKAKL